MIPQAFTMRDVSDAYRWAQTLPPPVRDEFKSVESLVSAFIKTKRLNNPQPSGVETRSAISLPPEQSRSAQDFQKALKELSPELNQFDFAPHQPAAPAPVPVSTPISVQKPQIVPTSSDDLDAKTRGMIKELRETLNLSHDREVIRACVAIAYKHLKSTLGL